MNAKPTYTKFHDFQDGTIAYMVKHPTFTDVNMYVETRRSGKGWIAYETYDAASTEVTGGNREEAVEKMLKVAEHLARGKRLEAEFYAELERLGGGYTTAWHNLMGGQENADDTVAEGNVVDGSTEYWELVWAGYNSHTDELSDRERRLAEKYNLIDLPVCVCCHEVAETVDAEGGCEDCAETIAQWNAEDETLTGGDHEPADEREQAVRRLLGKSWDAEWTGLTVEQQAVVVADFVDAEDRDPEFGATGYRRNIGAGNLANYANVLLAQAARGVTSESIHAELDAAEAGSDEEPTGFFSKTGVAHTAECATVKAARKGTLNIPMPAECEMPLAVVVAHVEEGDWRECGACAKIRRAS